MTTPTACPECLRRAWLLAKLGPYLENAVPDSLSPGFLGLSNEDLVQRAAPDVATQILAQIEALSESRLNEDLTAAGCWASCRHGEPYPESLRDAPDAPWALIGRGDPELLGGLEPFGTVTIVGSRRATSYGREIARELGRSLAGAGMVVVSGLAFGIDACAHRGALDAGRTIAVLGCGADVAYPATHRSLWRRICEQGLVVSELPPGAAPWRWTFPARNRIMAALGGMTVVVEAAARSGSLITADLAADLGRDLGAVPGPVTSRASEGPNNLLAGGACVIRDAQDVLDAMLGPGAEAAVAPPRLEGCAQETRLGGEHASPPSRGRAQFKLTIDCETPLTNTDDGLADALQRVSEIVRGGETTSSVYDCTGDITLGHFVATNDRPGERASALRGQREDESLREYDERRADEDEADRDQLDRLAEMLNAYPEAGRDWDHAEICNELVKALRGAGRRVALPDETEIEEAG